MAIALVQVGAIKDVTATSFAPTMTGVTAGNLVVACIGKGAGGLFTSTAPGWVKAIDKANSTLCAGAIWYLPGASNAGGTITPTFNAPVSANLEGFLAEFSGVDPNSPLGQTASGQAGAITTCPSGTLAGNVATSVAVTCFATWNNTSVAVTYTPGANYTKMANDLVSGHAHMVGDYRLLAPTGDSETETISTISASSGWVGMIAEFKVAPPAGMVLSPPLVVSAAAKRSTFCKHERLWVPERTIFTPRPALARAA